MAAGGKMAPPLESCEALSIYVESSVLYFDGRIGCRPISNAKEELLQYETIPN